jgi:hypothetical protein
MQTVGQGSLLDSTIATFTVLAPSNDAFARGLEFLGLDKSSLFGDSRYRPVLRRIVQNHVLPAPLTSEDLWQLMWPRGGTVTLEALSQGTLTFLNRNGRIAIEAGGSNLAYFREVRCHVHSDTVKLCLQSAWHKMISGHFRYCLCSCTVVGYMQLEYQISRLSWL